MNYKFSPEFSQKLKRLGVVSHFYPKRWHDIEEEQPVYSVFDILIPENAKKAFGEKYPEPTDCTPWEDKSHRLLTLIQQGQSIESIEEWLNETYHS